MISYWNLYLLNVNVFIFYYKFNPKKNFKLVNKLRINIPRIKFQPSVASVKL